MRQIGKYQVLYLTGPPATGKSTLSERLSQTVKPLIIYSYSKLLVEHLEKRARSTLTQDDIRRESARRITPEDVATVDAERLANVALHRTSSHIVVDSHAVTKEDYGFRVTPFSVRQVESLNPTMIIMLYAGSDVISDRIRRNSQGRPLPSAVELDMHTHLQSSVALTYSVQLGIPIYFLDSATSEDQLLAEVRKRLQH